MTRHFELRAQDMWFDEDGVVRCRIKAGMELELADGQEAVQLMASVNGGVRRPVLVEMGTMRSISRECRRFFAGPETAKVEAAVALIVKSPLQRAMGNFFMGLNKTLYPARLFTSEEDALTWLRNFLV